MSKSPSSKQLDHYSKLILGYITAITALITAVISLYKLITSNFILSFWFFGITALSALWLSLFYVYFRRTGTSIHGVKPKIPFYSKRLRKHALIGIISVPAITISAIIILTFVPQALSNQFLVLVAQFTQSKEDMSTYQVRQNIYSRLNKTMEGYDDVKVAALDEAITEYQGSQYARSIGEKRNAGMVIWGWYHKTSEVARICIHYEIMRKLKSLVATHKNQMLTVALAEFEKLTVVDALSSEMANLMLVTAGLIRYDRGDYERAIPFFTSALKGYYDGDNHIISPSIIFLFRGTAYLKMGNHDEAIADLSESIRIDATSASAFNNRGSAHYILKEMNLAKADYDKAVSLGERAKSHSAVEKALQFNVSNAYMNRGNIHLYEGDVAAAIADYSRAIEHSSDMALAFNNRGVAYERIGNIEMAISDYESAIQLRPDLHFIYFNLGNSLKKDKKLDEAISNYDKALELSHENIDALNNRGLAYYQKGKIKKAIEDYNRVIELSPEYVRAYTNRGIAFKTIGNLERGVEDQKTALSLEPGYFSGHDNLAYMLFELGNYKEALKHWEKALHVDPDHRNAADAMAGKAIALEALGMRDEAVKTYVKAVALDSTFLSCEKIREKYHWSEPACSKASRLISEANIIGKDIKR